MQFHGKSFCSTIGRGKPTDLNNSEWDDDRRALLKQLSLDSNDINIIAYMRLNDKIHWSYQTILDEVHIAMLFHLIKASGVSNLEIDECLESLLKPLKTILSCSLDDIKLKLQDCYKCVGYEQLNRMWIGDFEQVKKIIFDPTIKHLELRFERYHKHSDDQLERALALRDTLHLVGVFFNCSMRTVSNELMYIKPLFEAQSPKKLLKVFYAMEELHNMQVEGIAAAVQGG